jgi:hypothetical protein
MKTGFLWTGRGMQKNVKEAESRMREWQKNRSEDEKVIETLRNRSIREDQDQKRGRINGI